MKKVLVIIVLGLLLPSCIATVKPTGGIYKETQLAPEKSRIVIFRRGGSLIGMDTPAVHIVGTKTLSFYLPSKTFIQEDLKPGTYKVVVSKKLYCKGRSVARCPGLCNIIPYYTPFAIV